MYSAVRYMRTFQVFMVIAGLVIVVATSASVWVTAGQQLGRLQHEYARAQSASMTDRLASAFQQVDRDLKIVASQPVVISGALGEIEGDGYFSPVIGNLTELGAFEMIGLYDFGLEEIFATGSHVAVPIDVMRDSAVRQAAARAVETGLPQRVVRYRAGYTWLATAMPVLHGGLAEGVVVGIVTVDPILDAIRPQSVERLVLRNSAGHSATQNGWPRSPEIGRWGLYLLISWDQALIDTERSDLLYSVLVTISVTVLVAVGAVTLLGRRMLVRPVQALNAANTELATLQDKQRELAEVAERAKDAVVITGADGAVTWVNPAFQSLTGYTLDDVVSHKPGALLQGPDTSPKSVARISEAIRNQKSVSVELLNYHKYGTPYWIDISINPIFNDAGEMVRMVAIERDITRQKSHETALNKALADAEAANIAKGRFLANMSHEIRTPMNGIIGMTDVLLNTRMNADQRETLNVIRSSGEALVEIINDILDFSKLDSGHLEIVAEPTGIDDLVYEVAGLVKRGLDKPDVALNVDIAPRVPQFVQVDGKRLRQVLLNVVGNAYKFTETGQVEVGLDFGSSTDQSHLKIEVRDTGIGMSGDKLATIFEAFKQVEDARTRRFDGTGLGLAITKGLLGALDGSIEVTSEPGKGSVFSIQLAAPVATQPQSAGKFDLSPGAVFLICCADARVAKLWRDRLDRLGADVRVCGADDRPDLAVEQRSHAVLGDAVSLENMSEAQRSRASAIFLIGPIGSQPLHGVQRLDPLLAPSALVRLLAGQHHLQSKPPIPKTGAFSSQIRILAAEDNRTNRLVLKKMLAGENINLVFCENGQEAADALCCDHDFELVLMDISMPVMGGVEATQTVRAWEASQSTTRVPIIALTANATVEDRQTYASCGIEGFVAKPYKKQVLVQNILETLGLEPLSQNSSAA